MEKTITASKNERRWQLVIYAINILFVVWDLLVGPYDHFFAIFNEYSHLFLFLIFPVLGIAWLLALKSSRWGARIASIVAVIGLLFYFILGLINITDYQFYCLDILRFYLPRIFLLGATFIVSLKIIRFPAEQAEVTIPIFFFKFRWTSNRQKYILLAFLLAFGILGIQWLYPRASCAAAGGQWIRDGIFGQAQYCLYSYPDAGKACQSSEDCMGRCLVDTDALAATSAMPTAGVCAPDNRGYGCFSYFGDEAKYSGCVD